MIFFFRVQDGFKLILNLSTLKVLLLVSASNGSVAYLGILLGVGVQQIQLSTEDRDMGSGSPLNQGFWRQL